jgi:hypothetical protein
MSSLHKLHTFLKNKIYNKKKRMHIHMFYIYKKEVENYVIHVILLKFNGV